MRSQAFTVAEGSMGPGMFTEYLEFDGVSRNGSTSTPLSAMLIKISGTSMAPVVTGTSAGTAAEVPEPAFGGLLLAALATLLGLARTNRNGWSHS